MNKINYFLWIQGIILGFSIAYIVLYAYFLSYTSDFIKSALNGEICTMEEMVN